MNAVNAVVKYLVNARLVAIACSLGTLLPRTDRQACDAALAGDNAAERLE